MARLRIPRRNLRIAHSSSTAMRISRSAAAARLPVVRMLVPRIRGRSSTSPRESASYALLIGVGSSGADEGDTTAISQQRNTRKLFVRDSWRNFHMTNVGISAVKQ